VEVERHLLLTSALYRCVCGRPHSLPVLPDAQESHCNYSCGLWTRTERHILVPAGTRTLFSPLLS